MGAATASCQPQLRGPKAGGLAAREGESCDLGGATRRVAASCRGRCTKEESQSREVRDVHEFKASDLKEQLTPAQFAAAQRVVDRTLRDLVLGKRCHSTSAPADEVCLRLSTDMTVLELETTPAPTCVSEREEGPPRTRRVPLSQVVDASFGAGGRSLVLRFSDAMCMEPCGLTFASEQERLQVALALKVLRARSARAASPPRIRSSAPRTASPPSKMTRSHLSAP